MEGHLGVIVQAGPDVCLPVSQRRHVGDEALELVHAARADRVSGVLQRDVGAAGGQRQAVDDDVRRRRGQPAQDGRQGLLQVLQAAGREQDGSTVDLTAIRAEAQVRRPALRRDRTSPGDHVVQLADDPLPVVRQAEAITVAVIGCAHAAPQIHEPAARAQRHGAGKPEEHRVVVCLEQRMAAQDRFMIGTEAGACVEALRIGKRIGKRVENTPVQVVPAARRKESALQPRLQHDARHDGLDDAQGSGQRRWHQPTSQPTQRVNARCTRVSPDRCAYPLLVTKNVTQRTL